MALSTPLRHPVLVIEDGFTTLHRGGPSPVLDIVFVHGLNGHPRDTWTTNPTIPAGRDRPAPSTRAKLGQKVKALSPFRSSSKPSTSTDAPESSTETESQAEGLSAPEAGASAVFWPEDFLGDDFPNARVMTFGYDTKYKQMFGAVAQHNLYTLTRRLLSDLADERESDPKRPLLFICHSLREILAKYALVISQRASGSSERFQNVRKSVVGVIFFGTPHAGSALGEWGQQIRSIASIAASTNPNILAPLDTNVDNGQLEELRDEFNKMLGTAAEGKFSVHSFREMKAPVPIPHTPGNNLVVSLASAAINSDYESRDDLDTDHRNICKFGYREERGYKKTRLAVRSYVDTALFHTSEIESTQIALQSSNFPSFQELYRGCLKSLRFPRQTLIQESDRPTEGTFQWIWTNASFKDWMQTDCGSLWIQGKPGSGKSTLMQHLYHRAKSESLEKQTLICEYSFFGQGRGPENTMSGLLRSLILQIITEKKQLAQPVFLEYEEQLQNGKEIWTQIRSLQDTLIRVLNQTHHDALDIQYCFFLDAPDECDDQSAAWYDHWKFFMKHVVKLHPKSNARVKVCLSSRPIPRLSVFFLDQPTIVVEEHNENDIKAFLTESTQVFPEFNEKFGCLVEEIAARSNGVFLWAKLIWRDIIFPKLDNRVLSWTFISIDDLKCLVSQQHPDLADFYRSTLQKIPNEFRSEASRMLRMIVASGRPMTIFEFRLAWAFGSQDHLSSEEELKASGRFPWALADVKSLIKSRCGGLAEVIPREEDKTPTVLLIHESVREFVSSLSDYEMKSIFRQEHLPENGHRILARACTKYLASSDANVMTNFLCTDRPSFSDALMFISHEIGFFNYASAHWLHHVRNAETQTSQPQAELLANDLARYLGLYKAFYNPQECLGYNEFWEAWRSIRGAQRRNGRNHVRGDPGPLCVAATCNMLLSATDLLKNGVSPDEGGGFPIQGAAWCDNHEMVLLLLDHGASVRSLARKPPENLQHAILSPLRQYIVSEDGLAEDSASHSSSASAALKTKAVKLLLDRGLENLEGEETSLDTLQALATMVGNLILIDDLVKRAMSHQNLEIYISSALLCLVGCVKTEAHLNKGKALPHLLRSLPIDIRARIIDCSLVWILSKSNDNYAQLARMIFDERLELDLEVSASKKHRVRFRHSILRLGSRACVSPASNPARTLPASGNAFEAIRIYRGNIPLDQQPTLTYKNPDPIRGPNERDVFSGKLHPKVRTMILSSRTGSIIRFTNKQVTAVVM